MKFVLAALSIIMMLGAVWTARNGAERDGREAPGGTSESAPPARQSADEANRALVLARRLAAEPPDRLGVMYPQLNTPMARRYIVRRSRQMPLPEGGNFNGLQLTRESRFAPGELERTLQHNARCQWIRAANDGRAPSGRDILAAAELWPALRELQDAEGADPLAACLQLHEREVRWANAHGLTAST